MAHDCPGCGQACYCDMDDTFMDLWALGARATAEHFRRHKCEPIEDDDPPDYGVDDDDA